MSASEQTATNLVLPVGKVVALSAAGLPPLAIGAVCATAAFLLHWGRTKSLQSQYKVAKAELKQLVLERDTALTQLLGLQQMLEDQCLEYHVAHETSSELSVNYENLLMETEELQARLERSELFNQELQQTIRRERAERERRIAELEKRIQEQRIIINKLQKENRGDFTERNDIDENGKTVLPDNGLDLVTPPVLEGERRTLTSWPSCVPRPPVPFRELSFRNPAAAEQ